MSVLVFDTTHHALWAEQVAHRNGLAAEIEPAPPAARARCSLALAYLPTEESQLLRVLETEGVPCRKFEAVTAAE